MEKKLRPTGRMLVGATFICLTILIGAAYGAGSANLPDLQSKLKESTSLKLILSQRLSGPGLVPQTTPTKQTVCLTSSDPSIQVSDLVALNSAQERDIVCDEEQRGGPNSTGLVNSLAVSITGRGSETETTWPMEDRPDEILGDNVEMMVNNALNSSLPLSEDLDPSSSRKAKPSKPAGLENNLYVDIKGISVTALNTAEGGSAVATSNIVIKPVQLIICPSEVEEKLK